MEGNNEEDFLMLYFEPSSHFPYLAVISSQLQFFKGPPPLRLTGIWDVWGYMEVDIFVGMNSDGRLFPPVVNTGG